MSFSIFNSVYKHSRPMFRSTFPHAASWCPCHRSPLKVPRGLKHLEKRIRHQGSNTSPQLRLKHTKQNCPFFVSKYNKSPMSVCGSIFRSTKNELL